MSYSQISIAAVFLLGGMILFKLITISEHLERIVKLLSDKRDGPPS